MLLKQFCTGARNVSSKYINGESDNYSKIPMQQLYMSRNDTNWYYSNTAGEGCYVCLGTDDTSVTFTDYTLGDDFGLHINRKVQCVSSEANNYLRDNKILSITTVYQNITSEALTIKEIGLCNKATYNSSDATRKEGKHLLTRTVLDTPIIMQPGEQYAFTITILI